ncbi:MAG: double-strand break repair helicase AddA [Hyphomicrobiaceae bacterium]
MMSEAKGRSRLLANTQAAQRQASDPQNSAWVSANAGSGKTHVLKLRVLRLLLAGTDPERILCLTYTKAAAAEMATRVFRDLSDWAVANDKRLEAVLGEVVGQIPTREDLLNARRLFARAIETPGGLKVQTIHAFCERLLQRFPLEAGVAPGFEILDDATVAQFMREAIDSTLVDANRAPRSPLGRALELTVVKANENSFDDVMTAALSAREWLLGRVSVNQDQNDDTFQAADTYYRELFGVPQAATRDDLLDLALSILTDTELKSIANILKRGGKSDQKIAQALYDALLAKDSSARLASFSRAFLTKTGAPRADRGFITKAIRDSEPAMAARLLNARDRFCAAVDGIKAFDTVAATMALLRLADRASRHYDNAKSRRSALDFDDLIARTTQLLVASEAADWVLYKLDGGIDHILVDEAQDTSPQQWSIIKSLAFEFFSSEPGEDAGRSARSLFAVGDEKQSIYSFQGAAPHQFGSSGNFFGDLAERAGRSWAQVPLTLSFRTVAPLLKAVDAIFDRGRKAPGLNSSGADVRHVALRMGQAGRFELWPCEVHESYEPTPAFAPLAEASEPVPAKRLADKIAERIATWLKSGELLDSQARPILARDILILVRKRNPFAPHMVRALKARDIPVAGADRMALTEQIAVQDLMALGDFLILPEDDLSLAVVLKSPLFGFDDEDLLAIAPERKGSLWAALHAAENSSAVVKEALAQLRRWRAYADFVPPFEFFSTLLDRDNCREKLLSRLGVEAGDSIDEFLNLAIAYDDRAPASLQGFLSWLRKGQREIKRQLEDGRDEVRVMTVHGAKGLEAPIVFLPDTCGPPTNARSSPLIKLTGAEFANTTFVPHVWAIPQARNLGPVSESRAKRTQAEIEEHNRLLYVALTRARDRLYVGGYAGKRGRAPLCWYETISDGLDDLLVEEEDREGNIVRTLSEPQVAAPDSFSEVEPRSRSTATLPDWARRSVRPESRSTLPLNPSRLIPHPSDLDSLADEMSMDLIAPPMPSPLMEAEGHGLLRGQITHTLLEHLPQIEDQTERVGFAERYVASRAPDLSPAVHSEIVKDVLAVMSDPIFAPVFAPGSLAEVPVVAELRVPVGASASGSASDSACASDSAAVGPGQSVVLSGRIDRLVQCQNALLIVDYKTDRQPPMDAAGVKTAYILQLAAYRLALKQIYPSQEVRTAILWTRQARLTIVPNNILDDHQQRLWKLNSRSLDAL